MLPLADAARVSGGVIVENRRRAQRRSGVWMGTCHVTGDAPNLVRDCGIFDISTLGVGMDFHYADPMRLEGRRISVRLPLGSAVEVAFTGEVRNVRPGPGGIVRAGIEFVDLMDSERSIVDLLEHESVLTPGV
jgi:PilZ domain